MGLIATGWPVPTIAHSADRRELVIPAQALPRALAELARQDGIAIGAEGSLPDRQAPALRGRMTPGEALARLLAGTGLIAREISSGVWRIETRPVQPPARRPAGPSPVVTAGPILVTATKQPLGLDRVAQAIALFALPEASGATQAGQGSALVAEGIDGLVLTAQGPGRNRMFINGVADSPFNGGSASPVAVYVDDTRLTYSAPDPDLRLVDVTRVEVLKGPQGALFGTGALGGIYRVVTNRPELSGLSGSVSAGFSTVIGGGTGPSGAAMANVPIVADHAALRIVGYASSEPGWIDTGGRSDSNRTHVEGVRGGLGVAVGDWRADVSGLAQWINSGDSQYSYAPGARNRAGQLPEPHDNDLIHTALRVEGPVGEARLVATSGYSWHDVRDQLDATQGAEALASAAGLSNPGLFADLREYRVWDSEVRLSGAWRRLHWVLGLAHVEAREVEDRTLSANGSAASDHTVQLDRTVQVAHDTGLFADVVAPVTGRLDVSAGLRLFYDTLTTGRSDLATSSAFANTRTGVSPEGALSWRPHPGRLIYLRVGSAFRQGGLDTQGNGQIRTYPGDRLTTLTFGWRETAGDGKLIEVSLFHTWWTNVQSDMLLADGLIETRTAGDASITGISMGLARPLGGSWRIELGGTAQSARLVRSELGLSLDDTRLPSVPDYTARIAVGRDFTLARGQGHVRLALNEIGPSRLSFQPSLDRKMGHVLDSRLELGLTRGANRVDLVVTNPLARSGNRFAFGNPFRADVAQYTPQRPPAINLTIGRTF
ncbi:TonB-dependent receptor [Novosphingobium nitrogenifigens DSM 19370]|uniref:TonB-dependent receptor n=1 Tax=Novosphingobium nitrogenifigens DSM 19370 TaxID=983920 RepID=F1ZAI1_9SPHN|nr:TonB-dependent receptor [Novosphingobium nitrogenifigens]EGD58411.1 TonB-dependent receptor [Novosphingobium nitrogenifigens DSM 19370]